MTTPPQLPSETPTPTPTPTELDVAIVTLRDASKRIVQARNIRALDVEENISIEAAHLDLTCNAAELARQLEKELQEAKSSWGSQQALLKCGDEKIAQLTTELQEANRTRTILLAELSGMLSGLLMHPSDKPLNGCLISETSKSKLTLIEDVIKHYE